MVGFVVFVAFLAVVILTAFRSATAPLFSISAFSVPMMVLVAGIVVVARAIHVALIPVVAIVTVVATSIVRSLPVVRIVALVVVFAFVSLFDLAVFAPSLAFYGGRTGAGTVLRTRRTAVG